MAVRSLSVASATVLTAPRIAHVAFPAATAKAASIGKAIIVARDYTSHSLKLLRASAKAGNPYEEAVAGQQSMGGKSLQAYVSTHSHTLFNVLQVEHALENRGRNCVITTSIPSALDAIRLMDAATQLIQADPEKAMAELSASKATGVFLRSIPTLPLRAPEISAEAAPAAAAIINAHLRRGGDDTANPFRSLAVSGTPGLFANTFRQESPLSFAPDNAGLNAILGFVIPEWSKIVFARAPLAALPQDLKMHAFHVISGAAKDLGALSSASIYQIALPKMYKGVPFAREHLLLSKAYGLPRGLTEEDRLEHRFGDDEAVAVCSTTIDPKASCPKTGGSQLRVLMSREINRIPDALEAGIAVVNATDRVAVKKLLEKHEKSGEKPLVFEREELLHGILHPQTVHRPTANEEENETIRARVAATLERLLSEFAPFLR